MNINFVYSGTPLVRPPLFHQKSGISRGVVSGHCKEGVASRQGDLSKGVPLNYDKMHLPEDWARLSGLGLRSSHTDKRVENDAAWEVGRITAVIAAAVSSLPQQLKDDSRNPF